MNCFKLMSDAQREELRKAHSIIEEVFKQLDFSHDDKTPLGTSIEYLDTAINYNEKRY